jgi:5-oxoprolinase (ATP-hydrolysing)
LLGKIQACLFSRYFWTRGKFTLDREIVLTKFQELAATMGVIIVLNCWLPGFIQIAVENMANAIKKISLQKGYDLSDYTLCTFGGAGGQVACLIADTLGMKKHFLIPCRVLSALRHGFCRFEGN